jgi:3-oxoacyl-[acyl-carrier-protein] synthase II
MAARESSRRVVVTGMGLASPAGIGPELLWDAVAAGRSCLRPATAFAETFARYGYDLSEYEGYLGALDIEAIDAYLSRNDFRIEDKEILIAQTLIATREALRAGGLGDDRSAVGLSVGTNFGQLALLEDLVRRRRAGGTESLPPDEVLAYPFHTVPRLLARRFGLEGPNMVFSLACASSNFALGHAFDLIRNGEAQQMLAGGFEGVQAIGLVGAFRIGVIDPEPCKPFAKDRMGFSPGSGAAFLLLESLKSAAARGAEPLAEIIGFGASCDAYHITSPDPDGYGMALAMTRALEDAGIGIEDADYINAHGTATYLNDKIETIAIKKVFGKRAGNVPVSSTKSIVGHTAGASAAMEASVCCLAVREGVIPPTVHYQTPDPECDLDYVPNTSRRQEIRTVLNNSFAFGGNNSTLIVRKFMG